MQKYNEHERRILVEFEHCGKDQGFYSSYLETVTGIQKPMLTHLLTYMKLKGALEVIPFVREDDGMPMGKGYVLTDQGREDLFILLDQEEKITTYVNGLKNTTPDLVNDPDKIEGGFEVSFPIWILVFVVVLIGFVVVYATL